VKNHRALYIGKSGQLAVMAEFLLRGYNVAIPEIDVGDDIFVVRDDSGELSRIQVKSTVARRRGGDSPVFSAQFNVGVAQLAEERRPELHFVFAARCDGHWSEFLVIPRDRLQEHYAAGRSGRTTGTGRSSCCCGSRSRMSRVGGSRCSATGSTRGSIGRRFWGGRREAQDIQVASLLRVQRDVSLRGRVQKRKPS